MKCYQRAQQIMHKRLSTEEAYPAGFFIRDRRLFLKLKIEDFTPLCSPSTLSKIETGKLAPSASLLEAIYKRLTLSPGKKPPVKGWLFPIRQMIYHQDLSAHDLNEAHFELHYQFSLLKFSYYPLQGNTSYAKREMPFLEKMLPYFSVEELQFYFLFMGYYYFLLHDGQLSKGYYDLSYELAIKHRWDDPLLLLMLARYYSLSRHSLKAVQLAYEANALFLKDYAMGYALDCELLLCQEYTFTHLFSTASPLLEKLKAKLTLKDPYRQVSTLFNRYGEYYTALKDYPNAEIMYIQGLKTSSYKVETITSLMDLYYQSQQTAKLKQLLQQLTHFPFAVPNPDILKWKFYHYLMNHPLSDSFRIFLQGEAIPFAKKRHDRQAFELYSYQLHHIYEKQHKYKSALYILKTLNEKMDFLNVE